MLKFIRGKGQQPSAERQKLQKELFAFRKTAQHGFPHKPSAIAFDPQLKLMAIGTNSGVIKVFGQPGVEFYGQHTSTTGNSSECMVQLLEWVPGTGRVLSLTASNELILWEPAGSMLVPIKTLPFDGKLKKVSSLCCSATQDLAWIGTEGGNIYQFDLKTFLVKEPVIYHDVVLEQVPSTYKLNPGAIESIRQIPNDLNYLLIAYNRGLCVLWDIEGNSVLRSYISPGHGQSVGLHISPDGSEFTWYHADGSFATWNMSKSEPPKDQNYVPYGPDPCKSINNLVKGLREENEIVIFSGGMPRSAYGDHNCVSVHCDDGSKICLDFTSKVVDFFVTSNDSDPNQVEVLIVLLEEEFCAYDLTNSELSPIKTPYLHSVHASAVTCNHLASQVSHDVYQKMLKAGLGQHSDFSDIEWPIIGGDLSDEYNDDDIKEYEILLTGHEDGSVKFWDCTGVVLKPIFHFKTANLFGHGDMDQSLDNSEPLDDSEPPFRKAGLFDPYSDDPRLAVKKINLCPKTGKLVIAGTAGHIIIASFDEPIRDGPLNYTTMNLVSDRDGFVWKGHDQLKIRPHLLEENSADLVDASGVGLISVLQVLPPAAITCLALQSSWNLVSAGTAHGLVLYDYENHHPVYYRCTLNPNDLTGAGEQLSRRKSFKKTLRESFRRLRKGRSTRNNPTNATQSTAVDTRPIERQVEARPADDGMGSMVRCLVFAKTYITNLHTTIPTLWSGTNSSCVSVYVLHIPPKQANEGDSDNEEKRMVTAQLAKEIQLKHRAPVVGIVIFDQAGVPLDLGGPGTSPHRVLIASEEQFKVFSLPQLKPVTKYKLTAHEGARVRKLSFAMFSCRIPAELRQGSPKKISRDAHTPDGNISGGDVSSQDASIHTEVGLLCLTNLGDCLVLSIPELKRQLNAAAVRREDINGISSLCFTNYGEALYMMSSSELQRISLSATKIIMPTGNVSLEPLQDKDFENVSTTEQDTIEAVSTDGVPKEITKPLNIMVDSCNTNETLTNGFDVSPNRGNETVTSSLGDITVDSVRDHLNTTTTTLCSTTTEETVGRLSVYSTQTNKTTTAINMKDITDLNVANLKDLSPPGKTNETNTSSVVIKSVITSISHGAPNGEPEETVTTATTTRKESQF